MEDTQKKLVDVLKSFDTVMIATHTEAGSERARPMAVAEVDDQGVLWFVTSIESPKVDEAQHDQRGLVTGQRGSVFVSVSGSLAVVRDPQRIDSLWKPEWKVWFPDGKGDPSIALMRFTPEEGEYWDNQGMKGVRYLFEAARALVAGERAQVNGKDQHAKVQL